MAMIERGKKIYLCTPDLKIVTILNGVQTDSVSFDTHVKDYTELSFSVDKYIRSGDTEVVSSGYDLLDVYLYLYLENDGYYQMQHPKTVNDGMKEVKQVVAYSIEKEWEQKHWVGLKVNTGEKDSLECLVDGNVDDLGYAKNFITFYNPSNTSLSLIHILLTKMDGWSVQNADIDPLLWSKKIRIDENDISMYALVTNVIAPKSDCLIMFDRMNKRIKAFSRTNLDSYHYDTNIFIGYRNLANQIDIDVNEDSVFTRFNVEGGEDLNFRDVNYNDSHIVDYTYFMKSPYMSEAMIEKLQDWIDWRDDNRDTFADYSVQQNVLNDQIYDVKYRVPTYEIDWTQWDGKSLEVLQENLNYYNAVLTSLQVSVDPDPQYDGNGNYIPWTTGGGQVDHDRYLAALYAEDNGFGGYYTYYEVLNYIIPNIEIAITNISAVTPTDYITAYETDWTLYGIEELENKRRNYEAQLNALSDYSKRWVDMTDAEKAIYINDRNMYLSNGRQKYLDIQGYLGSTSTSGTLLYQLNQLQTQLVSLQSQLNTVTTSRTNMVNTAKIDNQTWGLTADELELLDTLTIDTTYTNNNIFTTDLDTAETKIDREMELYNDAVEKLSEVAQPQYRFSVTLDNLLQIPEFKNWVSQFSLLNYFRLGVRDDYSVKLRMTGYSYNPCEITNDLKIEFSSMISSRSGRSDLTYLINNTSGGSTGGSISSTTSRGADDKAYLTSLLNALTRSSVFKDGVNSLVGTFVSENATIDSATIHALAAGYISASQIDVDQLIVDDAKIWNLMAEVGIIRDVISEQGRFTGFLDAVNVNAANITTGTLTTDRLVIRGSNQSIVYALNNISGAIQAQNVDTLNGEIVTPNTINADRIVAGSITATQIAASTITAGKMNVSELSAITANMGTITAGQVRVETVIGADGYVGLLRTSGGSAGADGGLRMIEVVKDVGNSHSTYQSQFYVSTGGHLYALNANIKGTITADTLEANSGTIANWNITKSDNNTGTSSAGGHCYRTSLYGHAQDNTYEYEVGMKADSGANSAGYLAFYVKRITSGAAWSTAEDRFFVRSNGSMYAANAEISGTIHASGGDIAGWTITGTRIEKDNTGNSGYRVGIQNGTTGTAFYAGCSTAAGGTIAGYSAFYVTQAGKVYCNNIEAVGGTVGGYTISSTQLSKSTVTGGYEYKAYINAPSSITTPSSVGAFAVAVRTNDGTNTPGSWAYPFCVKYDGSLASTKGSIGGWSISSNSIGKSFMLNSDQYTVIMRTSGGATSHNVANTIRAIEVFKTVNPGTSSATSSSQFYVGSDGYLFARNANITGTISASSGDVGGWSIETYLLKGTGEYNNTSFTSGLQVPGHGTWAFAVGASAENDWSTAPFRIEHSGKAHIQSAQIDSAKILAPTILDIMSFSEVSGSSTVFKTAISHNGTKLVLGGMYVVDHYASYGGVVCCGDLECTGAVTTSGNIHVSDTANSNQMRFRLSNSVRSGALQITTSGALGVYNITNSRWLIYDNGTNVVIPTASSVSAKMTFTSAPYLNNNVYLSTQKSDNSTNVPLIGWSSGDALWVGTYASAFANRPSSLNLGDTIDKIYCFDSSGSKILLSTALSDLRLKHDIDDMQSCHDFIMGLRAKRFKINGEEKGRYHFGFIAQDVRPLLEDTVGDATLLAYNPTDNESEDYDPNDENTFHYSMDYTQFVAPIVAVEQEHDKRIEELEREIAELKEIIRKG